MIIVLSTAPPIGALPVLISSNSIEFVIQPPKLQPWIDLHATPVNFGLKGSHRNIVL